ncbi:MAG: VTT domain-containing protein [Lachnospiraceae bacterium]|nr:VTT domain-containing protein [Lachnospiraceae bacterium]
MNPLEIASYINEIFEKYRELEPLFPVLISAAESFFPPFPLVLIVTLNVAVYGGIKGFLYSWIGNVIGSVIVFYFFRIVVKKIALKSEGRFQRIHRLRVWVAGISPAVLFMIAVMPFTPSSVLNIAFGTADYNDRKYVITISLAKSVMILLLSLFGVSFVDAFSKPVMFIPAIGIIVLTYVLSKMVKEKYMKGIKGDEEVNGETEEDK